LTHTALFREGGPNRTEFEAIDLQQLSTNLTVYFGIECESKKYRP